MIGGPSPRARKEGGGVVLLAEDGKHLPLVASVGQITMGFNRLAYKCGTYNKKQI